MKVKGLTGFKVKVIFAWYDFWIGVFIDRPKKKVYIFLIPMIGIVIEPKFPMWWKGKN